MNLVPLEVRKQTLGGDQHCRRRIQLVEPAQLECRPVIAALPRTLRQNRAAKIQGGSEVDGEPVDAAVVHPPELGLKALTESNNRAGRMLFQEPAHGVVKRSYPHRVPPGPLGGIAEVVLEPVSNLYCERILKQ